MSRATGPLYCTNTCSCAGVLHTHTHTRATVRLIGFTGPCLFLLVFDVHPQITLLIFRQILEGNPDPARHSHTDHVHMITVSTIPVAATATMIVIALTATWQSDDSNTLTSACVAPLTQQLFRLLFPCFIGSSCRVLHVKKRITGPLCSSPMYTLLNFHPVVYCCLCLPID